MRRSLSLVGLALVSIALPALAAAGSRQIAIAQLHADRGGQALARGDLDAARTAFAKALAAYPQWAEAHIGLGHVAMKERRYDDALSEYATARDAYVQLSRDLKRFDQDRYLARRNDVLALRDMLTQLRSGNLKLTDNQRRFKELRINQAIDNASQLTHPGGNDAIETPAPLHFYLGNALFHLDRLPEAIAQWETVAQRDARFAPVHNNLALAYYRQGRFEQARGSVLRAESLGLTVDPRFKADLGRATGPFANQQIAAAPPAGAGGAISPVAAGNALETD
jgi:tetratricopeptide (TPR) repeat protein